MNTKELGRLCVVGFVAGAVGVIAAGMMGQGPSQPTKPDDVDKAFDKATASAPAPSAPTFDTIAIDRSFAQEFPVMVVSAGEQWLCVQPDGDTFLITKEGVAERVTNLSLYEGELFNPRFPMSALFSNAQRRQERDKAMKQK